MDNEPGLWLLLCGFLVFCGTAGLLLGYLAYDLVRGVFGG